MLLIFSSVSFAESSVDLPEFNLEVERIEKLIDNNAGLALQQLMRYQHRLSQLSVKQRINYHSLLAEIYLLKAQYNLAKQTADLGLSLTKELSSPSILIAEILYSRGFSYESIGDFELATQDYESGLEISKSFHDKVLIAKGLINLGAIYYQTDRYEDSLNVLNDAYNIAMQTTDEELKGSVNSELGILYAYIGSRDQSMSYYQQAYQHYKKAEKRILSLNALVNIGTSHLGDGKYDQAIDAFKTILKESQGIEQNEIIYNTYSGLTWANLRKEPSNNEASYQYLMMAKQYVNGIERHDIELNFATDEAFVLFELERFDEALVSIARIENILAKHQSLGRLQVYVKTITVNLKSKIYFELGHFQQAYQLQKQRLSLNKVLIEKEHSQKVAEVRLALEAKQADLHKKVLENKRSLQEVELTEAENKQQRQKYHVLLIALVALVFAWLLVKLVQGQRRLHKAVSTDMLTGVANRRSLMKLGHQLLNRAVFKKADFSVLMIDVDNFKPVNDEFGHEVGDKVLQKIAKLGVKLMRKTDVFGRYGGEEFMVFLPNTSLEQALIIAERLRASTEMVGWQDELSTNRPLSMTLSIGVVCTSENNRQDGSDLRTLIHDADKMLNQAKSLGRNRVSSL